MQMQTLSGLSGGLRSWMMGCDTTTRSKSLTRAAPTLPEMSNPTAISLDMSYTQAIEQPGLFFHGIVGHDASWQAAFIQLLLQSYDLLQAAGLLDPLLQSLFLLIREL